MKRFLKTVVCVIMFLLGVAAIVLLRFNTHITDSKTDISAQQISLPENTPEPTPMPTPEPTTVTILGEEYPFDVKTLDLRKMTSGDVDAVAEAFTKLTSLEKVYLQDAFVKAPITLKDLKRLIDICPDAEYAYSYTFYDKTFNPTTSEVYYKDVEMTPADLSEIRDILGVMNKCDRFVFDNCGFDDETMSALREEFRGRVKVVWRVYCGYWLNRLSDVQVIFDDKVSCAYDDTYIEKFKYFEDLKYVDLGHHQAITNLEWVRYTPKLEVLIISELLNIKDLTPLSTAENLWYLECYATGITDLTPLAQCTNLEHLNIGDTAVEDLSPLYGLTKLKRMRYTNNYLVTDEQQQEIREKLPDCISIFDGGYSYLGNWRWVEVMHKEKDPAYAFLQQCFGYLERPAGREYYNGPHPDYGDFYEREREAYIARGYFK